MSTTSANTAQALQNAVYNPVGPSINAAAVTPSDSVDLTNTALWLYVGGAGTLTVITLGGQTVQYTVPAGGIIPVVCTRVKSTGTTATGIVAHWM